MTTEDIIIQIFCLVDDQMKDVPKHSQAKLYPSELVTIGLLFALKGGHFRVQRSLTDRASFYTFIHAGKANARSFTRAHALLKAADTHGEHFGLSLCFCPDACLHSPEERHSPSRSVTIPVHESYLAPDAR